MPFTMCFVSRDLRSGQRVVNKWLPGGKLAQGNKEIWSINVR